MAGPALASWLVRAGCKVTVVERAPTLRTAGQGVDVRDSARDVIKRMGIFDQIRDRSSHEEGVEIVDGNSRCLARFGADNTSGKGESITCDIEILRGELAGILYDVTKDDVSYIFGDMVESLDERADEVGVRFANGTPAAAFDLVVAADGIGSKIRGMAFGNGNGDSHVRSLSSYVTYFSIPRGETDTMWSKVHCTKGGRYMMLRPDNQGRTRAFLGLTAYEKSDERLARLAQASKKDIPAQKALIQALFRSADWETPRILKGMHASTDLYMQHVAQVRLTHWTSPRSGRVTVVGDAGYAPSPYSGMGTSLAFIGAYILAGEISQQPSNIPAALRSYERVLRPYVESIQKLPPGVPWIVTPQSALGVRVWESVVRGIGLLSTTGIAGLFLKLAAYLPASAGDSFKLPDYEAFRS